VGEAAGLLDDDVDGFGAAVGDAAGGTGVEVGQDQGFPRPEDPSRRASSGIGQDGTR
jgi:hypothetical protein